MTNGKVVSGSVDLSVSGELKQLSREEIVNSAAPVLAFEFKYFQRLEGRLRLPKDFVPTGFMFRCIHRGAGLPG
jgi:hypothetical protein